MAGGSGRKKRRKKEGEKEGRRRAEREEGEEGWGERGVGEKRKGRENAHRKQEYKPPRMIAMSGLAEGRAVNTVTTSGIPTLPALQTHNPQETDR